MFTGIIEKIGKVSHVTEKNILILTANQWFDDSILTETSIKKFYFPSINLKKGNYRFFVQIKVKESQKILSKQFDFAIN